MKPVHSVPRARPRGFSLIEVLAAMVIFSAGAVILFGWIAQTADRLGRLGSEQQTLFAQLAGLDFIRTLNPMQRPSGEALIGSTTVRWQAKPVGDESAVREGNGAGRYVVRLYQVRINTSNARDAGAEQSVYLAGWRELPARAPLGADTIPAPECPALTAVASGAHLIELLVSLLILGFVLALVSQAIYQVAQVARASQEVTASLATRWTGGTAAAPVIANLALPLEAPEGKAFEGNTTRLAGFSTQPPTPSDVGVRAFVLELRRPRDGSRGSELWAVEGDTLTSAATETVLARFDARAEFVYADDAGELRPFWPFEPLTPGRETRELPAAVVVRDSATRNALAWYGFQGESVRQRPLSNPFATAAP